MTEPCQSSSSAPAAHVVLPPNGDQPLVQFGLLLRGYREACRLSRDDVALALGSRPAGYMNALDRAEQLRLIEDGVAPIDGALAGQLLALVGELAFGFIHRAPVPDQVRPIGAAA